MPESFKDMYDRRWSSAPETSASASGEIFETFLSVIRPGGELLDAGCGRGVFLKLASGLFGRVRGADISSAAVAAARAAGLEAVEGDVCGALPFADASFDVCSCADVIEHVIDPAAALREIRRVLRPGGQLLLATPNVRCFRHIVKLAVTGEFPRTSDDDFVWGGGHVNYFTRRDLRRLLEDAGFSGPVFVLNPGQFGRSWKRRLARAAAGERLFGEFIEGSAVVSCSKGAE